MPGDAPTAFPISWKLDPCSRNRAISSPPTSTIHRQALCTVFLLLARAHIKILTAYDEQGQTGLTFLAGGEVPVNSDRGLRLELERT